MRVRVCGCVRVCVKKSERLMKKLHKKRNLLTEINENRVTQSLGTPWLEISGLPFGFLASFASIVIVLIPILEGCHQEMRFYDCCRATAWRWNESRKVKYIIENVMVAGFSKGTAVCTITMNERRNKITSVRIENKTRWWLTRGLVLQLICKINQSAFFSKLVNA